MSERCSFVSLISSRDALCEVSIAISIIVR
jgi:hypothetical protein